MPYTGPGDDTLPDYVKEKPEDKRAQWVTVWNDVYERCRKEDGDDCEGRAFAAANAAVVDKREDKVPQAAVNYVAATPSLTQQCSNCRYFQEDACELVQPPITAEGLCTLWRALRVGGPVGAMEPIFDNSFIIPRTTTESEEAGEGRGDDDMRNIFKRQAQWTVGADRDLPISDDESWDGAAAEQSIWAWAGFDGDNPDPAKAKRAFLVYDASAPEKKGSYKLPFARYRNGRLEASQSGLDAAAGRLPQTDIPSEVQSRARAVIDHYRGRMEGRAFLRVFEDDEGRVWWLARSGSAFLARDKRIIPTQALQADIARSFGRSRGPLLLAHWPNVRVGECLYGQMAGRILVEAGVFDDTDVGRAAAEYYKNTDRSHTVSIRWESSEMKDGVFADARIIERSILPAGLEADGLTEFNTTRGRAMKTDEIKAYVQEVLNALPAEQLDALIEDAERLSAEAEEEGLPARQAEAEEERQDEEMPAEEMPAEALTKDAMNELLGSWSDAMMAEFAAQREELQKLLASTEAAMSERIRKLELRDEFASVIRAAIQRELEEPASESADTALDGRRAADKKLLQETVPVVGRKPWQPMSERRK